MTTDSISIPMTPDQARVYRTAPPEEQARWRLVLELYLKSLAAGRGRALAEVLDVVSAQAERAGLTEAELKDILDDDDAECH